MLARSTVVGWHYQDALAHADTTYTRLWGSAAFGVYVPTVRVEPPAPPWPLLTHLKRLTQRSRDDDPTRVTLETGGAVVREGARLRIRVDIRLAPPSLPGALYAGVLSPDGHHVTLFSAPNVPASTVRVNELRELLPLIPPAAGLNGQIVLFDARVSPVLPSGEYRIFAALATTPRPRSPDDRDFLAADVRSVRLVR